MSPVVLSEKDYSSIEKLYCAAHSLLLYARARGGKAIVPEVNPPETPDAKRQTPDKKSKKSSIVSLETQAAPTPVIPPSDKIKSILEKRGPPPPLAGLQDGVLVNKEEANVGERRTWAEFASLFWRIAYAQKAVLLGYISSTPVCTLTELLISLLQFVKRVFSEAEKSKKMEVISSLGSDKILYFLRCVSSEKKLMSIVNEDADLASQLKSKFCSEVKSGQHLSWMSLVYVSFCEHAAQCSQRRTSITSLAVFSVSEILRCVCYCCENSVECANEFLFSEPVPCTTYMFNGIKLRIQTGQLIRPLEAQEPTDENHSANDVHTPHDKSALYEDGYEVCSSALDVLSRDRSKMSSWKSFYFSSLEQCRDSDDRLGAASKILLNESFNPHEPSEFLAVHLYHLLQLGRCNAFDELMHLALDTVITAVKTAKLYSHWAMYSVLDSFFTLSVKGLVDPAGEDAVASSLRLLPLYENVVVLVQMTAALLETLEYDECCEDGSEEAEKKLAEVLASREEILKLLVSSEIPQKLLQVAQCVPHFLAADNSIWRRCRDFISLGTTTLSMNLGDTITNTSMVPSEPNNMSMARPFLQVPSRGGELGSPLTPEGGRKIQFSTPLGSSSNLKVDNKSQVKHDGPPMNSGTSFAKSFFKSMFGGKGSGKKVPAGAGGVAATVLSGIVQDNDSLTPCTSGAISAVTSFGDKPRAPVHDNNWLKVESYAIFGSEVVSTLNAIVLDEKIGVDVQCSAGFLLANSVLKSSQLLEYFESRITLKNLLVFLQRQLEMQKGETDDSAESANSRKAFVLRKTLSRSEFSYLVDKVLSALEGVYFSLGLNPLTTEEILLTELPPYFFQTPTEGHSRRRSREQEPVTEQLPMGIAYLEPYFARVVSLWMYACVNSQCDEDMDIRSISVLMGLFERALNHNQLPKDSIPINPTTPEGKEGSPRGLKIMVDSGASFKDNHLGLFGNTSLYGRNLPMVGEKIFEHSSSSVESLSKIFKTVLTRFPSLVSTEKIDLLFSLFSSTNINLVNLGKECIVATFDFEEVYRAHCRVIAECDISLATQLLSVLANYLFTMKDVLNIYTERRKWLVKHGCFDGALEALCSVLRSPHVHVNVLKLVSELFSFFCAFEPEQGFSPCLQETHFIQKLTAVLTLMSGAEYQVMVSQAAVDAATVNYFTSRNTMSNAIFGSYHLPSRNCSADKPIFLDLLPPIAVNLKHHHRSLYDNLLEVLTLTLKNTTVVDSFAIRQFVKEERLTTLIPYLELPDDYINDFLPFTGPPRDLLNFWRPILLNSPQRSEIRFSHTGGVKINVGSWPAKGLTISGYFYFDDIYSFIPLFQFSSSETTSGPTAATAQNSVLLFVSSGDSVQIGYHGHNTPLNESNALQNFQARKWLHFSAVVSVRQTVSVYLNGFFVGSATMPSIPTGSEICIRVGFADQTVPDSLYSIGDIAIWDNELTRPEIEANLAVIPMLDQPEKIATREIARETHNADVASPVSDRIARYVPYENNHSLLLNILDCEGRVPIIAKVIGRHAPLPKRWISFQTLWVVHGGMNIMLNWLHDAATSTEFEEVLEMISDCIKHVSVVTTIHPNLYLLLLFILKEKSASLMTIRAADFLLSIGVQYVIVNDVHHDIITNRQLFKFVLSDSELYARMPDACARHVLQRLETLFIPTQCQYARHNAKYIVGNCFVDRLLHSMIRIAPITPLPLRNMIVKCTQRIVVASDMEEFVIHSLVSLTSVVSPTEMTVTSRFNPSVTVTLPETSNVRVPLPFRTSDNVVTMILRSLVDLSSSAVFMKCFARHVGLPWYITVIGRFANPASVVYATKLFFEAVSISPALRAEVAQHQSSVIEALFPHAKYEDVILLLLAFTIGAEKNLDLMSEKISILKQLDSCLGSFQPVPNVVISPIFVKMFTLHLSSIISWPYFDQVPTYSTLLRQQKMSFRIRRYFSLARVCCRFMLFLKAKRYKNSIRRRLMEVLRESTEPDLSPKLINNSLSHSFSHENISHSFTINANTSFFPKTELPDIPFSITDPENVSFSKGAPSFTSGSPTMNNTFAIPHRTFAFERVRHPKYKRAFAVLRVCVLLQVTNQVNRFSHLFEKALTKEERIDKVSRKHEATLFCLSTLRRFATMSSLYYVFVSSPIQVTAFSAFISYISRTNLRARLGSWDEFVDSINPAPIRGKPTLEGAVTSNSENSPVPSRGSPSPAPTSEPEDGPSPNKANMEEYENPLTLPRDQTDVSVDSEQNSLAAHFASLLPPINSMSSGTSTVADKTVTTETVGVEDDEDDSSSCTSSTDSDRMQLAGTLGNAAELLDNPPSLADVQDPTFVHFDDFGKVVEVVGEVVRREAVGVLGSLIKASLQTPSHQGWVGGPSYGSCGGLLFQMLLILSSKSTGDDSISTLIKYFQSHVISNVRDQQNPDHPTSTDGIESLTPFPISRSTDDFTQATTGAHSRSSSSDSNYSVRSMESKESRAGTQMCSEIFLFNVSHFSELVVDLLSTSVVDLNMIYHYFTSLLVLSQSWPARYIHQLGCQVLKCCIFVLNKPSTQDVSLEQIETIYSLTTLVIRRGFKMKGSIECLFRTLYKVYISIPPVWMSEADAFHRNRLIVLIFRHMVKVYHRTKELKKAFAVRTLTQRFSLYDALCDVLLKETDDQAILAFDAYCKKHASSMETLISHRMKQKTDLAHKSSMKSRGDYIKRIKEFNKQYIEATEVTEGYRPTELRTSYLQKYTSYVATVPVLSPTECEWLIRSDECLFPGTVSNEEYFHFLDAQCNFAKVRKLTLGPETMEHKKLFNAAHCELQLNHISLLAPQLVTKCKPFSSESPPAFIDPSIMLSPSAITLMRFMLDPGEVLQFISNGFRIFGIQSTPCLILLTNVTLKVISFSHVTSDGEIVICKDDEEEEVMDSSFCTSNSDCSNGSGKVRKQKGNLFSFSAVTKQIQRLLNDKDKKAKQQARDGTKIALSVRQATGSNYKHVFWTYVTRHITEVRCVHYMHQDTAVSVSFLHDSATMLSIVDSANSMNSGARAKFLSVLKGVVNPSHCNFIDDTQRGPAMKSMLLRWATGAVSNYDYLLFLNQIAGRTNMDFNQYPVFPWVIADYTSKHLDLEQPDTFRLFNYPMGAQTEQRREAVTQLYNNTKEILDPETGKSYPFHHGTHYSSSGAVLYFMIRSEPYTTFAKFFQGGDFDIATRLFDSVSASYNSCVLGPADCKELTPEFYQNGQFLMNLDNLDFGSKSDGVEVNNVVLPPWAKNSTQVFTSVMRFALESEFVLNHIHAWIDLVFGVRRRGKLAFERYNIFQRMTYGEEVRSALKEAETRHDTNVIIAEVDNFGQTPMQLFTERHPAHHELEPVRNKNSATTPASFHLTSSEKTPLAISSSFGSGNTYTSSYEKQSAKVMSMLIHAMDQPPTRFLLREFVSGQLLQVPDNLPKYFRIDDRSVMNFATLSSGRIAPSFKHMIAVMGENYYTCWHKHEGRLMRFGAEDGRFMSILPFEVYNVSCQHICAVAMSPSESALLIGTKAGAIYFLHSDIANRAMYLKSTFCHHTNPISKFAIDHRSSRAISFTTDLNDIPRVWLLQRHYAGLLHPLNTLGAFPHDLKDEDKIVVDACINSLNYHAIVITNRCLAVFDDNGDVFGVGSLANPRKMEGSIMLEDDDGEIGVAVEGASSMFVSNLTAVEAYQTREWASGMSLFLTGHKDGSLSLWRMTRLPPDTVQPGRIAVVEFHGVIQDNKSSSPISGSVTCIKQEKPDIPLFFIGYSNGASRVLEFTPPQLVSEEKGKSGEKKK